MFVCGVVGVPSEDRDMIAGRVPTELKKLVDADQRSNQDVLEAALWREYGGEKLGALDRRIEEQKQYIAMKESQYNERGRELEDAREELEALKAKRERVEESEQAELAEWRDKLATVPHKEDHPLVVEAAEDLGMDPAMVLDKVIDE